MMRIDRLREDSEKRILRCSEGNSIWYQLWIDPGDMMRIEPLLGEVIGYGVLRFRNIMFSFMK